MGQVIPKIEDTVCAPATPAGRGGISVIRVSGPCSLKAVAALGGAAIAGMAPNTLKFCILRDKDGAVDQAVVSYFAAPKSYTGQDVVEISVHGSPYIVNRLMSALFAQGVRLASPGEFTQRAFLNGKLDLSEAEAVADLIAAESRAAHNIALCQLRGGFSNEIENLRARLLEFVSLVELELDFGEEDVEFADRTRLRNLLKEIDEKVKRLRNGFYAGNALKDGIPVAIVGEPNVGKSTLLNLLLREERALVSEVAGTTRDTVEEVWYLDGVKFRFIDTAGLRESGDKVEKMGIERTYEKMRTARVWLYLYDMERTSFEEAVGEVEKKKQSLCGQNTPQIFIIGNKLDKLAEPFPVSVPAQGKYRCVCISAKTGQGIDTLTDCLKSCIPQLPEGEDAVIMSNARHFEALGMVETDLQKIHEGLENNLPGDLLSIDIHSAIDHLGLITGKIVNEDILGSIFSQFCIGK